MDKIREQIEFLRTSGTVGIGVNRQAADTMEKLLAVYEAAKAVHSSPHFQADLHEAMESALDAVQTNHVTTGDVRLDLGWIQEECDAADREQTIEIEVQGKQIKVQSKQCGDPHCWCAAADYE